MTHHTPSAALGRAAATTGNPAGGAAEGTSGLPARQGLYDPRNEHDACGVGFIAHMKGAASHRIVLDGLAMLENLTHRGAVGADPLMGDGAGVLVQIPHRFFAEEMAGKGIDLPEPGHYAVGYLFMPQDGDARAHIEEVIADVVASEGATLIGFRDVPVDNSSLSKAPEIAATEPYHRQVFIGRDPAILTDAEFERKLFVIRKVISGRIFEETGREDNGFYIVSMSSRTIVYKGMFLAYQVGAYYRRPSRRALRVRRSASFTSASRPTPSPPGSSPTPTAWSRTTARSTRFAATSTGWRRGRPRSPRRSSATTSRSSGRSPTRASRTRPASTMRSSFSCRAAIRWPMR